MRLPEQQTHPTVSAGAGRPATTAILARNLKRAGVPLAATFPMLDKHMTEEERKLLLAVARWVLEQEEKDSRRREDTSSLAAEMRAGIDAVRPKNSLGGDPEGRNN